SVPHLGHLFGVEGVTGRVDASAHAGMRRNCHVAADRVERRPNHWRGTILRGTRSAEPREHEDEPEWQEACAPRGPAAHFRAGAAWGKSSHVPGHRLVAAASRGFARFPSPNTYSCCASRTTNRRAAAESATTNSNPERVGSMVMNDVVPSSFF